MKKIALAALLVVSAFSANAGTELVANGNFETGTFTAWNLTGNTGFSFIASDDYTSNTTFTWLGGAVGSFALLDQTIQTVAGRTYDLSFDVHNETTTGTQFTASFNGSQVYGFTNEARDWNRITIKNLLATSNATSIQFGVRNDSDFIRLDNVSVQAVPEPETWAMMIGGLGMLAFMARRRKAA
jgi:PEP-CTERM motif